MMNNDEQEMMFQTIRLLEKYLYENISESKK